MKTINETICGYDALGPASNVNALDSYWYNSAPITINATAVDLSGPVDNVTLWYNYSSDNSSSWSGWIEFGTDTLEPWSFSFNFPSGDGFYQFFSTAYDSLSNPEPMKNMSEVICGFDSSPPTSSVDAFSSYWYTSTPIQVTVTASGAVSGLASMDVYYRYSSNNSTWGGWTPLGSLMNAPWTWSFNFPDGDGFYEFHSIASDNASNVEGPKSTAEASCGYDVTDPTSSLDVISIYWQGTLYMLIFHTKSNVHKFSLFDRSHTALLSYEPFFSADFSKNIHISFNPYGELK